WGLVEVTDAATGVAIKDDLVSALSINSYVTYQWFRVDVAGVATPPEAIIARCGDGPIGVGIEETFDGSGSLPGSAPIGAYEWDFDYDGTTFAVDASGPVVQHAFTAAGTPTVALRVTAGSSSDIATLGMQINGTPLWSGPTNLTTNTVYDAFLQHRVPADGLSVTPDGTMHVVYHRRAALNGQYTVIHQMLPPCSATWTPEAIVYDTTLPISAFANVASCATADGSVHAVFGYANGEYGYSRYSAGAWSPAFQAVTRPASNPTWWMVTIAGTPAGEAAILAAGHRYDQPNVMQTTGVPAVPSEAWFTERALDGTWGTLTLVGQMDTVVTYAPGSHSWWDERVTLAGLNGGEWMGVWASLRTPHTGNGPVGSDLKLKWARTTAGAWAPQTDLYEASPGTQLSNPNLATAPNGDCWLALKENSGIATAVYRAGAWSATRATAYTNGSGSDGYANLAFDADGRGTLAVLFADGSALGLTAKRFPQSAQPADLLAAPAESIYGSQSFLQRSLAVEGRGDGRLVAVVNTERTATYEGREIEWFRFE
ncbi:MAG TPA: PKD domain-containing protein, partial [bacterium]|nr:PKD domain-containing protein [bacterium]